MRPSLAPLWLPLALAAALTGAACSGSDSKFAVDTDSGAQDTSEDTDSGGQDTGEPVDNDVDNDGFTPDDGDCDDNNASVSPVREEDTEDAVDNDCDGRVDEAWSGVTVAWPNGSGASSLLVVDRLGDAEEIVLDNDCYPTWIDSYEGGWVINNGGTSVAVVTPDGTCTVVADFSDAEAFPYGVWGVVTGKDGSIYATTVDALWRVEEGGPTQVAAWETDFEDYDAHEAAVVGLAVDMRDGTLGLFDYFGGFATWAPGAASPDFLLKGDYNDPPISTVTGAAIDGGGWVVPGVGPDGMGIFVFNETSRAWVQEERWDTNSWGMFALTVDGDIGDYYVTANGGWYGTVWRVQPGTNFTATLFQTDGTASDRPFQGLTSNYY